MFVPEFDEPHHIAHQRTKGSDGPKGAQAHAGAEGVQKAQTQNAQLLVQVLHRNRAASAHQVVTAVLQQRVHGHDQEATQTTQHDKERHGQPEVVNEVHRHHKAAHGNAQRHEACGVVQLHLHRRHHGAHGCTDGYHAHQARRLCGGVAQSGGAPCQHDVAQVAAHSPEQSGGCQRNLT